MHKVIDHVFRSGVFCIYTYIYMGRPECQADTTVGHSSAVRSMQHKTPCLLQVGMRLPGLRPSHACCRRRLLPHLVVVACPLGVCGRAVHGAVERPRPAAKVEREHATAALASCSAALPSQVRLGQFLAACSQVWQVRSMSLRLACDLPWLSSCVGYTARLN